MLQLFKTLTDEFFEFITQDPVRPNIPGASRVGDNKDVMVLRDDGGAVKAITCISYMDCIPESEAELFKETESPNIAVFYSIWSYKPGSGRALILDAVKHIKTGDSRIERFVTLSPKTEMARRFHTNNGATVFRENETSVNYEYTINIPGK